jgi:hypothetical protein
MIDDASSLVDARVASLDDDAKTCLEDRSRRPRAWDARNLPGTP